MSKIFDAFRKAETGAQNQASAAGERRSLFRSAL